MCSLLRGRPGFRRRPRHFSSRAASGGSPKGRPSMTPSYAARSMKSSKNGSSKCRRIVICPWSLVLGHWSFAGQRQFQVSTEGHLSFVIRHLALLARPSRLPFACPSSAFGVYPPWRAASALTQLSHFGVSNPAGGVGNAVFHPKVFTTKRPGRPSVRSVVRPGSAAEAGPEATGPVSPAPSPARPPARCNAATRAPDRPSSATPRPPSE